MNIFAAAALYAVARKLDDQYEFQGLQISIENKAGSVRTGVDKRTGKSWETRMRYDYGYIRLTKGVDGDHVDCFIGPNQLARYAYIVHQNNPHTGKFDEDKCFLGFNSATAAKAAYNVHYDEPWKFYGSMDEIPMDTFIKKVLDTKQRPKVIKAKSVHAGGPGSGCNPAAGKCGRHVSSTGAVFKVPDKRHAHLFKKYSVKIKEYDPARLKLSEGMPTDKRRIHKYMNDLEHGKPIDMLNIEKEKGKDVVMDGHHRWAAAKVTNHKVLGFEVPAKHREAFYDELSK